MSLPKVQGFVLYRIYYDSFLVYLGRTKQPLQNRIRGHLMSSPMHRTIDIHQVTKVEYAVFQTEADMNLYEIYFINLWKPPLNVDDKCKDALTVTLPEVQWEEYPLVGSPIWEKWLQALDAQDGQRNYKRSELSRLREQMHIIRSGHACGNIADDTYEKLRTEIEGQIKALETEQPGYW